MYDSIKFIVIDNATKQEADIFQIVTTEDWSKDYVCADGVKGFTIKNDGTLFLIDEWGNRAFCPPKRFTTLLVLDDMIGEQADDTETTEAGHDTN